MKYSSVPFRKATLAAGLLLISELCPAQVRVGPNIRVSRNSDAPRVELKIAANPKNSADLIGASIVSGIENETCVLYVSLDGGNTWSEITPSGMPGSGSGDPQVAFGADGAAYFTVVGRVRAADGKAPFVIVVFRSENGGMTWNRMAVLGAGYAPDHELLVADPRPDHSGIVMLSAGVSGNQVGIFRSEDGGKTFQGPEIAAKGDGGGRFTENPIVFSNGTIFVPFLSFQFNGNQPSPTREAMFVRSDDGEHFSVPQRISTIKMDAKYQFASPYASVEFASDASKGRFRDRLYMVWGEPQDRHYLLKFAYSKDMGSTWSSPRTVSDVAGTEQFRPAIAVNNEGIVGVSWFDSRLATGAQAYDEFFAFSSDGGESFRPAARVSRATSRLRPTGNTVLKPAIDTRGTRDNQGDFNLVFMETNDRFPDEGEYMGMAADAKGAFHPFWSDTRAGSSQAWTAKIVLDSKASNQSMSDVKPLLHEIELVLDPARFDTESGVEEIPVRLRNVSQQRVCRPLVAETKEIRGSAGAPEVLNATNGMKGKGAQLDYSQALGDFSCLEPGGSTEALVWRIKLSDSTKTFISIKFAVSGTSQP